MALQEALELGFFVFWDFGKLAPEERRTAYANSRLCAQYSLTICTLSLHYLEAGDVMLTSQLCAPVGEGHCEHGDS